MQKKQTDGLLFYMLFLSPENKIRSSFKPFIVKAAFYLWVILQCSLFSPFCIIRFKVRFAIVRFDKR